MRESNTITVFVSLCHCRVGLVYAFSCSRNVDNRIKHILPISIIPCDIIVLVYIYIKTVDSTLSFILCVVKVPIICFCHSAIHRQRLRTNAIQFKYICSIFNCVVFFHNEQ